MKNESQLWCCAGRSVTGVSHINSGIPCQDYCKVTGEGDSRRVIALADGAGSAKHCQEGARLAVEIISKAISDHPGDLQDLTDADALEFGKLVHQALIEKSIADACEVSDYACTLLAAAFQDGNTCFWQVGDGGWIVETAGGIECATWPFKGAFNNETAFVTQEDWSEYKDDRDSKWQFVQFKDARAALGFTDGLEMFCLDAANRKPHLPFVERIFSVLRSQPSEDEVDLRIEQMLTSSVITEREDDDLTMVLAWNKSPNAPG